MVKKRKIAYIAVLACIILCVSLFDFAKYKEFPFEDGPILIAHGGGSVDGDTYLNSLEAVEDSLAKGFRYIELDLRETTDHDMIAAHTWEDFHRLTGYPESDQPVSLAEAKSRKIKGSQTVLSSADIIDLLKKYPDMILVTDKIKNIPLIRKKFGKFLQENNRKIIVELFSYKKYKRALKIPGVYPALCVNGSEDDVKFAIKKKIPLVTLDADMIETFRKNAKDSNYHISVFAYGGGDYYANNPRTIKKSYPLIKGWYTDFVSPKDIENELKTNNKAQQ